MTVAPFRARRGGAEPLLRDRPGPRERRARRTGGIAVGALVALLLFLPASTGSFSSASPRASAPPHVLALGSHPASATDLVIRTAPAGRPTGSAASSGEFTLLAVAKDPSAFPNEGTEANFTGFGTPTLPPGDSLQSSAVATVGTMQVVFGLFENTTTAPFAFYSVYKAGDSLPIRFVGWVGMPIVGGVGYLLSVVHESGLQWEVFVNGAPLGGNSSIATATLDAANSSAGSGLTYGVTAYMSEGFTPPPVNTSLAFATLANGSWYLPRAAEMIVAGTPSFPWGMEGRAQHPTLAPGALATGPSVAPLSGGSLLWNSSPLPIGVTVGVEPGTVPANGETQVTITTTDSSGFALPGVYVQLTDVVGSTFEPATVQTDGAGRAIATMLAPNASTTRNETLRAVSTLFGFVGNGSVPLTITGVVRAFFHAPSEVTVGVDRSVGVTFTAVAANGSALAGLPLAFEVNGTATVDPEGAFTDARGTASATVQAPGAPSTLLLRATVAGPGFWGVVGVVVHVTPPRPPWYVVAEPYILYAFLLIGAGLLVYFVVAELRRPPAPLPPFPRTRRPGRPPVEGPPAPPPEELPPPPQP